MNTNHFTNYLWTVLTAMLLMSLTFTAEAVPIPYTINFDASNTGTGALGSSGTGSFLYDQSTNAMTNLVWDFGNSDTGGVVDATLNDSGGSGGLLFLSMTGGLDPHTNGIVVGPIPMIYLVPTFPNVSAKFCYALSNINCGMAYSQASLGSYDFVGTNSIGGQVEFRGYMTAAVSTIPEPETYAQLLAGLGMIGMVVNRRS
jgi:hypothetical protein